MRRSIMRILYSVEGIDGKFNDIIFNESSEKCEQKRVVCYFGGDVQDYEANMRANAENSPFIDWSLENTCKLLSSRFASSDVLVVRANRYNRQTYACFDHFVRSDSFGAPKHEFSAHSLNHLRLLITNCYNKLETQTANNENITFIGFSKGCVVLNQFLYSFFVSKGNSDLTDFISRITDMYWLDGGHSGGGNTWITANNVLTNFATNNIKVHIHVTPYQIKCPFRPWIAKEEKAFYETLISLGVNVERFVHFNDQERSLKTHFNVLNEFKPL